jgi:hypothetical protein
MKNGSYVCNFGVPNVPDLLLILMDFGLISLILTDFGLDLSNPVRA